MFKVHVKANYSFSVYLPLYCFMKPIVLFQLSVSLIHSMLFNDTLGGPFYECLMDEV